MSTALTKKEQEALQKKASRADKIAKRARANKKRAQHRGAGALAAVAITEVIARQASDRIAAGEPTLLPEVMGYDVAQIGKPIAALAVAAGAFGVTGNEYADEALYGGGIAFYTALRTFDVIAEMNTPPADDAETE